MKKVFIIFLIFFPLTGFAEPIKIDKTDRVSFNPQSVCLDLMGMPSESNNFGYDEWRNFKTCIEYFHSVDQLYY